MASRVSKRHQRIARRKLRRPRVGDGAYPSARRKHAFADRGVMGRELRWETDKWKRRRGEAA